MKKPLICLCTTTALLLTGCASIKPPSTIPNAENPSQSWAKQKQAINSMEEWIAKGVIGIRIEKKGESANLVWKQKNPYHYYIEVYGPLGIGSVSLTGRKNSVTFTDRDGEKLKAKTAEQLMQQKLGWHIPAHNLYYWGRGLPSPNSKPHYILNQKGLIATLDQDGWEIHYLNYQLWNDTYPLPGKIIMKYKNITLTVVIQTWNAE